VPPLVTPPTGLCETIDPQKLARDHRLGVKHLMNTTGYDDRIRIERADKDAP
jgi:hypothetical protein